jgi:cell shape-determining protein MreC
MRKTSDNKGILTGAALCILAVGLFFAPANMTAPLRRGLRDAVLPGQRLTRSVSMTATDWFARLNKPLEEDRELAELRSKSDLWQLRCRRLQIENALLNQRIERTNQQPSALHGAATGQPLIIPELLDASLLGAALSERWRSGRLLDRGTESGIGESDRVLSGTSILIDQGADAQLAPDQPVYSGRIVVGKVAEVGRWTSTLERVNDPGYRGTAQIIRRKEHGDVFGARGLLEGRGDPLCRLTRIPATEAVDRGDEVYTADRDGILPYPMYYGQIVHAELKPGAPYWDLLVRPAAGEIDVNKVHVLRMQLNRNRLLAE